MERTIVEGVPPATPLLCESLPEVLAQNDIDQIWVGSNHPDVLAGVSYAAERFDQLRGRVKITSGFGNVPSLPPCRGFKNLCDEAFQTAMTAAGLFSSESPERRRNLFVGAARGFLHAPDGEIDYVCAARVFVPKLARGFRAVSVGLPLPSSIARMDEARIPSVILARLAMEQPDVDANDPVALLTRGKFTQAFFMGEAIRFAFAQIPGLT